MSAVRALAAGIAGVAAVAGVGLIGAVGLVGVVGVSDPAMAGGGPAVGAGGAGTSAAPLSAVPGAMLVLYQQAASTCPGLSWTVLAAIGTVESDNGTSDGPGVHSGANAAGAEGPMQFEPATFAQYALPVPAGGADPPSPYDPTDAVYAAARLLCADGAGRGDVAQAVFAYNHSLSYVTEVLQLSAEYRASSSP